MESFRESMMELTPSFTQCIERVRKILDDARNNALRFVNTAMVAAYWQIGREIVEEEQRGQSRAEYGGHLISELSKRLTGEFGRGFSVANLKLIRQFYLTYKDRSPEIGYSVSSQSPISSEAQLARTEGGSAEIGYSVGANLQSAMRPRRVSPSLPV